MKTSLWNRLFGVPPNTSGRVYFFLSVFFVSFLYLWRVVEAGFFLGTLNTLLRVFFFIGPVFCVIVFFIYFIGMCIYVFRSRGNLSPTLILVGGYLLARFLPIPSTPEEFLFSWQRAKYEYVVELAHSNQLQQGGDCLGQNLFTPPSGYFQWSNECVYVGRHEGIIVEFAPRSLERPIVYIENPTRDKFSPCVREGDNNRTGYEEGLEFKQLSEHWFICQRWPEKEN